MIDPQYTKVGFGIIKYQEEDELAYFLITQTFLK
jgi:Holliday junction resolvasome RuvABC endonuclease subunit